MAKRKYAMNPGKKIAYKAACVRHEGWGRIYRLIVTNQSVIWEKCRLLNPFRGFERFDTSHIHQVMLSTVNL